MQFNSFKELLKSKVLEEFAIASEIALDTLRTILSQFRTEVYQELASKVAPNTSKCSLVVQEDCTGALDLALNLEDTVIISKHKVPFSTPKNDTKKKNVEPECKLVKAISTFGLEWNSQYNTYRMRFKLYSYKGFGGYRWSKSKTKTCEELSHILEHELITYKEQAVPIDGTVLVCDPNDVALPEHHNTTAD